ncbi:MAG: hypothetical protein IPK77_02615 [Cellvibrio sp.]|jgi:hypothetical protein|nr:hypothetical protein [Cellvibrio sp.]
MKTDNQFVLNMILSLAGIEYSQALIGSFYVDLSLKKDEIIQSLEKISGKDFNCDVKKWIDWYKKNFDYSAEDEINMQFAIVMKARNKVESRNQ